MTIEKVLKELGARNIKLRRDGGSLVLIGNQEALESSLIEEIRAHKTPLLEMIGSDTSTVWDPAAAIRPEMVTLMEVKQEEIDGIVEQVEGGAGNVQEIYPLAPLQEGILFHSLMGGEGDPYLLSDLMRFARREDLERYVEALQWVVNRHDILRTGVIWEGLREPVQVVWRKAELKIEEVELAGTGEGSEQLYEMFSPRRHRIDVRQAPMMRGYKAQEGETGRWLLLLLLHHLIGDHSTMEMMQEEMGAYLLGQTHRLPEPEPFRNLVAQARLGATEAEHEEFFGKLLGDVEETTAPFGLLEVKGDGSGVEEATLELGGKLVERMRERARRLKVSVATLCHLGWGCVVGRTSGKQEAIFGTVLFGRMQGGASADRVMGPFVNTLPVRMGVGEEGVEEAVGRMQGMLAELVRHEHAPLALAQRCSGVEAPLPLFTSLLNYRHIGPLARTEEERQLWRGIEWLRSEERTNYPITLSVDDFEKSMSVTVQAEESVNPMRVCQFMQRALEELVEALEQEPGRALGTLEIVPESEWSQLVYGWNAKTRARVSDKCVHELLEEQVAKRPQAVAVVDAGRELTYDELNRRANRLARYLRALGVQADDRVAVCVERSLEMVVGLVGVLKAGGAYVPLDPEFPVERLHFMVEDSGAKVLLVRGEGLGLGDRISPKIRVVDVGSERRWQEEGEENVGREESGVNGEHLAYVIYTSGSTGEPKGSEVPHRAIAGFILGVEYARFDEETVLLQHSSVSWDALTLELWPALLRGGRSVLAQERVLGSEAMRSYVRETGVNTVWLTAALLNSMVESSVESLRGVRYLLTGGETASVGHVRRVLEQLSDTQVVNGYGPSECTVFASCYVVSRELPEGKTNLPIGQPIGDRRVYVLDEGMNVVPVGVMGEAYIGGASVARGYLRRAGLTAERFVPDPYGEGTGQRLYRTGDLVRWNAEGMLEFVGRADDQVKVRGYRIELGEIEAQLRECAGVAEAAVLAREDGGGEKRLVAYYSCREGEEQGPAGEQLRADLAKKLPDYMVPAVYVRMEQMPLTTTGKLDRRSLPEPGGDVYAQREYEEPQGETEKLLAEIWSELLGVERVGRKDNFFQLGGHSLLALRLISRIRQALEVEVTISDLFSNPEIFGLADRIVNMQLAQFDTSDTTYLLNVMRRASGE